MDRSDLLNMLDLENGSEFTYFENLADLLETDGELPPEALVPLLEEVDMSVFSELLENYFDDLMDHLPDNGVDIYNILEAEKRMLVSLSGNVLSGEENALRRLSDELERFHTWFSITENCVCSNDETNESRMMPLRDALSQHRLSGLDGSSWSFDFDEALGYEVEDYIVSFEELAESGLESEER